MTFDLGLPSFIELQKHSRMSLELPSQFKLAVLGDTSTQHFAAAIKGMAAIAQIGIEIFDAGYNQIDAQIFDKQSELYQFQPHAVLFYFGTEKLYEDFLRLDWDERKNYSDKKLQQIETYWKTIQDRLGIYVFQSLFWEFDDGLFGAFSNKTENSFHYQVRRLNYFITEHALLQKEVLIVDFPNIQNRYGRKNVFSSKMYYLGKLTVSLDILPAYAKAVLDIINAVLGKTKKCIILDLDNTLWGGVAADFGADRIEIGSLGRGQAFSDFQKWLKELKNRGILLAVCSKNDEHTAKEPFNKQKEMILQLDDFVMFVANWESKADNILNIQRTLNIGMDSIVFIDDSPFERNLVREALPDVTVPEMPEDPADYLEYLRECNYFEAAGISKEDQKRTEQYRGESERRLFARSFSSYDEYLKRLEMQGSACVFDYAHISRIAQLTQRSNQFNVRTIRYSEHEIEKILKAQDAEGYYFELSDKYGDYGLVSVVILRKINKDICFIDTWLMSCRVLKRGMENFVMNKIVQNARKCGFSQIYGEFIPTKKNALVESLYLQMGFCEQDNNCWVLNVDQYEDKLCYIREVAYEPDRDFGTGE